MMSTNRNSTLAVISEYLAKSMLYGVGYLTARTMQTAEFGRLTAALALALVVTNLVDAGMGQIVARHIAQSNRLDATLLRQLFTWRCCVALAACLFTVAVGRLFLPPAAYWTAVWLTPSCLLMGFVDLMAWILKGLQRIPAYCGLLVGSRGVLFAFSLVALLTIPGVNSMLLVYGVAGVLSCLAALHLISNDIGPLRLQTLNRSFMSGFLSEIYKYSFILIASTMMVRIDLMLVAKICGEAAGGLYGCAAFVMDGVNLIPIAVYGVCLPAFAANRARPERLSALFEAPFLWLFTVSLLIVIWGPMMAGSFFSIFFGARYAASGVFFKDLLWSCIPYYGNMLLWALLLARNDLKTLALSIAAGLGAEIVVILVLLPRYGPEAAAWSRALGMGIVFSICLRGVYRMHIISHETLFHRIGLTAGSALVTSAVFSKQSAWVNALASTGFVFAFLTMPLPQKWGSSISPTQVTVEEE